MSNPHLKAYFDSLLKENTREEERTTQDYRDIEIEVNPIIGANGSARVKMGDTEVIAGVKIDVGTPFPDNPNDGILISNAELLPLASSKFESGPPRANSIELARVIDRGIRESKSIDMEKMCIIPKEKVWMVFVDVYPINDGGNLLDAGALAATIALKNARFPKYDEKEDRVLHSELTDKKLPLKQLPIMCTFAKLNNHVFLDPTSREEEVIDARLSITTIANGNICSMQKGLGGAFTAEEIKKATETAISKGKELRKLVK